MQLIVPKGVREQARHIMLLVPRSGMDAFRRARRRNGLAGHDVEFDASAVKHFTRCKA